MRKVKYLLLGIIVSLSLTGCTSEGFTEVSDATFPTEYGVYEWVSPDGVHYWVMSSNNKGGIAPRYNSNGELVID